jgi:hypothetical protein
MTSSRSSPICSSCHPAASLSRALSWLGLAVAAGGYLRRPAPHPKTMVILRTKVRLASILHGRPWPPQPCLATLLHYYHVCQPVICFGMLACLCLGCVERRSCMVPPCYRLPWLITSSAWLPWTCRGGYSNYSHHHSAPQWHRDHIRCAIHHGLDPGRLCHSTAAGQPSGHGPSQAGLPSWYAEVRVWGPLPRLA